MAKPIIKRIIVAATILVGVIVVAVVFSKYAKTRRPPVVGPEADHAASRDSRAQAPPPAIQEVRVREHENKLSDRVVYQQVIKNTAERYQRLKGQAGVIWGRLDVGEIKSPIRMRLRTNGRPGGPELTVTPEGLFAFDPLESGRYEIVVYETADTPGIRYENYVVDGGKARDELVIVCGKSAVKTRVVDENGAGLGGVEVTVGKSTGGSGSQPSLYMYRRGITDAEGNYLAKGLVDGAYTVIASFAGADTGTNLELAQGESKDVTMELRLHGRQLRGFVKDVTGRGLAQIPVAVSGEGLSKTAQTIQTGEFVIAAVPKGKYVIRTSGNEFYLGDVAQVTVGEEGANAAEIVFVLHLRESAASICGSADVPMGKEAKAIYGVVLTKKDGSVLASTAVSAEDGAFTLKDVFPGTFTLSLWKRDDDRSPAQNLATATIEIPENTKLIEGIRLVPEAK